MRLIKCSSCYFFLNKFTIDLLKNNSTSTLWKKEENLTNQDHPPPLNKAKGSE